MDSHIIDKTEIELAGRKIEVRIIESNINQHNYGGHRVYAKFIDDKHTTSKIEKVKEFKNFQEKKIDKEEKWKKGTNIDEAFEGEDKLNTEVCNSS